MLSEDSREKALKVIDSCEEALVMASEHARFIYGEPSAVMTELTMLTLDVMNKMEVSLGDYFEIFTLSYQAYKENQNV